MEQLRRQSTEVWRSLPSMPSFKKQQQQQQQPQPQPPPTSNMTGTWERIHLSAIPRSSHSLDVISGCAYIFGGEVNSHQALDNDMHVIRLPFSSAGADYFKIPAKPDASAAIFSHDDHSGSTRATSPTESRRASPISSPRRRRNIDQVSLGSLGTTETAESTGDEGGDDAKSDTKSDTKSETSAQSRSGSRIRKSRKGKERALDVRPVLPDVPPPRVGHATATIGARIFMFGGRGGTDMKPLDEGGRVWVFDTRTRAWAFLDPVPAVKGGSIIPHPAPRSSHCAAATDRPRDFASSKKAASWQEWALGDTAKTGTPQNPLVGHVAEDAVDEESNGYGTFFVHAGGLASGDRTSDLWAFDVRSRTWTEFPAAPSPGREGSSICVSKNRLYRFGGFDGHSELGGQLDFIRLDVEMFDDSATRGEMCIRAGGGWQTVYEDVPEESSNEAPLESGRSWPEPRSASSLQAVTVGGGTDYLILTMGEKSPATDDHEGAGKFFSDIWVYQVPSLTTGFASSVLQAMGRRKGEGKWTRVLMTPYDEEIFEMPRARGRLACAPMADLEESGVLIWGGLDENNRQRGEGWILRLGNRDTPNGNS